MATVPDRVEKARDPKDDARARAWAAEMRELAEHGELKDDTDEVRDMLREEIRNLDRR